MKPITLEKDSYTLIFEDEYIEVKTNDDNLYAFLKQKNIGIYLEMNILNK